MPVANSAKKNSDNKNVMGALAYLLGFVTGIVLLLVEKKDKFVRFHAAQSTVVFGILFVLGMVPVVGWVLGVVIAPVSFILWLVLMWKAYQGEMFKLPICGDWAEKLEAKVK
ncbi:MAG: hypothetical protein M1120_02080 [Patescibacteria group bacterium]|nr:hypothetical protein [Patescibacteria group bacterium]